MKRASIAQLVSKHLQLSEEPLLLSPRSTKTTPADHPGPVFEIAPRRRGGGWIVEVWLTAGDHLAEPRPLPAHRLWVQVGGEIEVEDVDPSKRRRGRRRIHPEGQSPRRVQVDLGEDLVAVERRAKRLGMSASAVVAAIVAHHERGVPLPW